MIGFMINISPSLRLKTGERSTTAIYSGPDYRRTYDRAGMGKTLHAAYAR